MLDALIGKSLAIGKSVYAGQIDKNGLNPFHLAVATEGYRIQSHTLHVPDRMGFFSPGPPRLQVYEASSFFFLVCWVSFSIGFSGFMTFLIKLLGAPNCHKVFAGFLSWVVFGGLLIWFVACHDRHRVPGYEWEDWKLRTD